MPVIECDKCRRHANAFRDCLRSKGDYWDLHPSPRFIQEIGELVGGTDPREGQIAPSARENAEAAAMEILFGRSTGPIPNVIREAVRVLVNTISDGSSESFRYPLVDWLQGVGGDCFVMKFSGPVDNDCLRRPPGPRRPPCPPSEGVRRR